VLASAGFVPNVEQSAESLFGMRILFAGMPCAGFLIGALLFRGATFEVDAKPHATAEAGTRASRVS
jgi:Na+/melibiose symporter-like transporter